jgi:hypothetical protein
MVKGCFQFINKFTNFVISCHHLNNPQVIPESPACSSSVRPNDIIIRCGKQAVVSSSEVRHLIVFIARGVSLASFGNWVSLKKD